MSVRGRRRVTHSVRGDGTYGTQLQCAAPRVGPFGFWLREPSVRVLGLGSFGGDWKSVSSIIRVRRAQDWGLWYLRVKLHLSPRLPRPLRPARLCKDPSPRAVEAVTCFQFLQWQPEHM